MTPTTRLIVNGDDLGLSPGVNAGIFEAHDCGLLTSASLMTRWPAAEEAAAGARARPRLGIGLHVDLGESRHDGQDWQSLYEVVPLKDAAEVEREIRRQLQKFRELMGSDPDHLDSHQHVHRRQPASSIMQSLSRELNVPLRHFSTVRYCGDFYGQTGEGTPLPDHVSPPALLAILAGIKPGETVELCCHPSKWDDAEPSGTMYRRERLLELESLCSPRVIEAAAQNSMRLCTFASLKEVG